MPNYRAMGLHHSPRRSGRALGWAIAVVTALAAFAAIGAPLASARSAGSTGSRPKVAAKKNVKSTRKPPAKPAPKPAKKAAKKTVKKVVPRTAKKVVKKAAPQPRPAPAAAAPAAAAPAAAPPAPTPPALTAAAPATGSDSHYAFLATDAGRPVRYDPCTPIHYVANLALAPANALADLQEAVRRIGEATGLSFVYDGTTTEVPASHRGITHNPRYRGWPPVLIGWAAPSDSDLFTAGAIGEGGSTWFGSPGHEVYVTGVVVLDATQNNKVGAGFGGSSLGAVLMHELGHLVGLDHVDDTTQLMYQTVTDKPAAWGPGDLAGLRQVGRSAGCITEPLPPWRA
ncbi:MAG: hypothetical protein QOG64_420 [Acidimicrobiaceae bacterium]|nr:hypothetical protein [Acidimicrobiaceae bacterium]